MAVKPHKRWCFPSEIHYSGVCAVAGNDDGVCARCEDTFPYLSSVCDYAVNLYPYIPRW